MFVLLALLATLFACVRCDCDVGWTEFGSKCYFPVVASEGGPDPYEATCQGMGASIVSIHSAAENQFVADLITATGEWCPYIRIGLELVWDSGTATLTGAGWTDGSPVDFGNPVGNAPGTFPWGVCGPGDGPQPSSVPARNVTQLWITEVSGWDCPVLTWYNTRPASAEFFGTHYDDNDDSNYHDDVYSNDDDDNSVDHDDHPVDNDNRNHDAEHDDDHSNDHDDDAADNNDDYSNDHDNGDYDNNDHHSIDHDYSFDYNNGNYDDNHSNLHYDTNDNAYDNDAYYQSPDNDHSDSSEG
ncbi:hypothetical protein AAVH_22580 [Aphelenchoides avenae]|nr:hypothetical protein AAVH_22580 [Aphelenchus avenae]